MSRWHLAALTAGVLALVPAPAYAAGAYPAPSPVVNVNHATVTRGGTVRLTGVLGPNDTVTVHISYGAGLGSVAAVTTADGTGAFAVTLTLSAVGTATITALGQPSGDTATTVVQIVRPAVPVEDDLDLPTTGVRLEPILDAGAALITIGGLLVGLALVRRRSG